jgi:transcriptional regulator with XRE-family HTH domain
VASPDVNKVRLRALIRELRDDLGISYEELARRLTAHGVEMDSRVLNNRLNRGNFTAGFALTVLQALGVKHLDLPEAPKRLRAAK